MKEKDFQLKVEKFLTDKGIYWVKYWGGGHFTRSGVPDLLCCIGGRFVGVELKTDDGKVAELQQYNIDKIIQSGGVALVLRPSDFEQFKDDVQKIIEEHKCLDNTNKITLKSDKEFQIFEEIISLIKGDIDIKYLGNDINEITLKIVYDKYHYMDFLYRTEWDW